MKLSEFKKMVASYFSLSYMQVLLEMDGKIFEYMEDYKKLNNMPVGELGFYDGM